MESHLRKGNPLINAHMTFFFVGLSSVLVYPLLDLNSFVYLRFLGVTVYDAESISFFLRRLNLLIGLVYCSISMAFAKGSDSPFWSWFLFISYFLTSFYAYALSQNYFSIGKVSVLPVVFISIASHGLLTSGVWLLYAREYIYLDRKPTSRFIIFSAGFFTSGLLVKFLTKFTTGEVFSYTDSRNTLRLYNRLFVSFTLITLICSFLTSTLKSIKISDEELAEKKGPPLSKPTFIGNSWIFTIAIFCWSFSPMLNNLSLPVMRTVQRVQCFQLEYYQFFTSLLVSILFYIFDWFDVLTFKKRAYTYNSLHRSICTAVQYRNFTPFNEELGVHQDVREDFTALAQSLSLRVFREVQPWQCLPYGFWIEWEDYDNFDTNRILNILSIYMSITDIRNDEPFNFDEYYRLGCTYLTTPMEHYAKIVKLKYTLLWLTCSYVNYLNVLSCKVSEFFKNGNGENGCCLKFTPKPCCCVKGFQVSDYQCTGSCCCCKSECTELKNYMTNALNASVEECNALLYDINTCPLLSDTHTVDYKQMLVSLRILEEFLMRLIVSLIYGRIIDEYLVIHKYMKCICDKLKSDYDKYKEGCKCNGTENGDGTNSKCSCTMYCKMITCVCILHKKQRLTCDIFNGISLDHLIDVMPPISLSRAIILLASFFHEFMTSDFLCEKGTCKCSKEEKKCCCIGDTKCCCCLYNSRVDDILSLMLLALEKPTDSDSILSHVITVLSNFTSFKYPFRYHDAVYYIPGVPAPESSDAEPNVLTVFASIYSQFSSLMASLLPPGHLRPGNCTFCLNEAGLCPCLRQLLSLMRDVCGMIEKVTGEIGTTNVSICYIVDYEKIDQLYVKLECVATKLKNQATACKTCCGTGKCCGDEVTKFVCSLCESVETTVKLVKELNNQSKSCIESLSSSMNGQLEPYNKKNISMYKSIRGTRMAMVVQPSRSMTKFITYYKKTIIGRVSDYKRHEFYLFILITLTCLILIYLSRLIPYLRNVPNMKKFKTIIIIYSFVTAYFFNSSFSFLASFDYDSPFYISLAIIFGLIISFFYSWLTQWFTYRMYLYEQFLELYSRFRLLFPGARYAVSPPLFWWIEGFVSFIRMDMLSMYHLFTINMSKEIYSPFSFGFTTKLNVDYNLAESDPHIFTDEECLRNIKNAVFESKIIELKNLLDYRSFYYIRETDDIFMKVPSINNVDYPLDLLYEAWCLGSKVSEYTDRLYHMREMALKAIEKRVQIEAQNKKYDLKSINKLKIFFDFQQKCLIEAPRISVIDSKNRPNKSFLSLQSRKLIRLYEKIYSDQWAYYFDENFNEADYEEEEAEEEKSDDEDYKKRDKEEKRPKLVRKPAVEEKKTEPEKPKVEDMGMDEFLKIYDRWRTEKLRNCDKVFGKNDVCEVAVTETCREFEKIAFTHVDVTEVMNEFIKFVSTSFTVKDTPKNFEIIKYLSRPPKIKESHEIRPILNKISELIRGHTFGVRSSMINDLISVCKNMEKETTMAYEIFLYDRYLIGEWIRWQGLYISGDLANMLRVINVLNDEA